MEDRTFEVYNTKNIVGNINLVFKLKDITKLSKGAYHFITQNMGFIAHYSCEGFQGIYADLRDFTKALQTSEYSGNYDKNLEWADELESENRLTQYGEQNRPYVQSEATTIREIVKLARQYQGEIEQEFRLRERQKDINTIKTLMAKQGLTSEELGR